MTVTADPLLALQELLRLPTVAAPSGGPYDEAPFVAAHEALRRHFPQVMAEEVIEVEPHGLLVRVAADPAAADDGSARPASAKVINCGSMVSSSPSAVRMLEQLKTVPDPGGPSATFLPSRSASDPIPLSPSVTKYVGPS